MMKKIWSPFCKVCLLSCFLTVLFFVYPLLVLANQADEDNKSVLDGFQNPAGQASNQLKDNGLEDPPATSENTTETKTDEFMEEISLSRMIFQSFLALAAILLMIYALIRFIGKRSQSYQANRTLQNIGGVHIGTNRSIQLVRVGDRVLVVGVGESIQLLKEIDNPDEVTTILKDYEIQEGKQQFTSLVKKLQTKFSDQKKGTDQPKVYFKSLLERQLKDVKKSQSEAHAAIKEREQR